MRDANIFNTSVFDIPVILVNYLHPPSCPTLEADVVLFYSAVLWQKAHDALRAKDKTVIPSNHAAKPEELIVELEKHISESKGRPVRLPNGENLFVRDVLQKVSRWIKKFVQVGDTVVQYDTGHAALPWALLRLILQMSMNNIEKHAAILEGIEKISYYLVWSRIEEACLAVPFDAHVQLELAFVQLYTTILTFTARSLRFLRNKPQRIASAFFSSDSKFQNDVEQMASQQQSIESYARQISDQTNLKQYNEMLRVKDQLADLNQPLIRIEHTVQSTLATIDRAETQSILDWVSEVPFQRHFKTIQGKALAGTGEWLFQDPEFSAWQTGSRSQILWLHGSAGSGKSTLTAMIIRSLLKSHEDQRTPYPIYFFCSRNTAEPMRADPEQILRLLIRQASDLPRGQPLQPTLSERFGKRRAQGDISAEEVSELMVKTIESRPVTYIVIDALDECDRGRREILVDSLKTILVGSKSLVKIFVTSRSNHQDIVWSMKGFPALCIDASRNQVDIAQYVQFSVQRAIEKRELLPTERVTAELQKDIVSSLRNGADGMFRWVELQLEFLYTLRKTSVLRQRLKSLPPGLERIYQELYEYNIRELGEEQAGVVRKILSWLLVAKIPLSSSDLCRLVCAPDEPDMSTETVLDMTFDLVRLDTEQDQFRFSHLSVREFLEKRPSEFGQDLLHGMAVCTCLSLLTTSKTVAAKDYEALYWLAHAEDEAAKGGRLSEQQISTFLNTQNDHFRKWNTQMFQATTEVENNPFIRKFSEALVEPGSPLLITTCFALTTQMRRIISNTRQPVDLESKSYSGAFALSLAARRCSLEDIQFLLDRGADVNAQGGSFHTALQAASIGGSYEIVELLLDKGAFVNAQGDGYGTALQAASAVGRYEIVELLLDRGAVINVQGGYYGTALQAALRRGHYAVMKLLLDGGADVDAKNERGQTLFIEAIIKADKVESRALVENSANPAIVDSYGRTAIDWLRVLGTDDDLLESFKYEPESPMITDSDQLRSHIRSLSIDVLDDQGCDRRSLSSSINELGHCFLMLHKSDQALFAFQWYIDRSSDDGVVQHRVICDNCQASPIVGQRFVCRFCPDTDLCASCMAKYDRGTTLHHCFKHEFMEVSTSNLIQASRDEVDVWLKSIRDEYSKSDE